MDKYARDRNTGLWIEHSDRLFVEVFSSVASLVVIFSGYFRRADGEVIEYAVQVNPTSDRASTSNLHFFGPGFLLSCTAHLQSGNANRGQCYVRARVQRSTGTPLVVLHQILGGYLTDDYSPSFPFGKVEGPLEGPGALISYALDDPAAGANFASSVPTGARWRVIAFRCALTADVNAANRNVLARFLEETNVAVISTSGTAITATQVVTLLFGFGYVEHTDTITLTQQRALPNLYLPEAASIELLVVGIQAGDQLSNINIYVEEWIEA